MSFTLLVLSSPFVFTFGSCSWFAVQGSVRAGGQHGLSRSDATGGGGSDRDRNMNLNVNVEPNMNTNQEQPEPRSVNDTRPTR
jgi:hypothetical protein